MLLQVLRGESVDWDAVEQKHLPSFVCTGCDSKEFKNAFSEIQWKRTDGRRFCKHCENILSCEGLRKECLGNCQQWLTEDCFSSKAWRATKHRQCNNCTECRQCQGACGKFKKEEDFTPNEWKEAGWAGRRQGRCKLCMKKIKAKKNAAGAKKNSKKQVTTQIGNGEGMTTPVCATLA